MDLCLKDEVEAGLANLLTRLWPLDHGLGRMTEDTGSLHVDVADSVRTGLN